MRCGRRRLLPVVLAAAMLLALPAIASAGWTSAMKVSSVAITRTPVVVVDSAGRATAAWAGFDGARYVIQVAKYANGKWTAPTTISTAGRAAAGPKLGLAADDGVTLVWYESATAGNGPAWSLMSATSAAGSDSWTTTPIDAGTLTEYNPVYLAVEPGGDATVVYLRNVRITAVRRVGGVWKTPVQVYPDAMSGFGLARTSSGAVVVGWQTTSEVGVRVLTDATGDGTWGSAVTTSVSYSMGSSNLRLTPAGSNVILTWAGMNGFCGGMMGCSFTYGFYASRFNPGSSAWVGTEGATVASDSQNGSIQSGATIGLADGTAMFGYAQNGSIYARSQAGANAVTPAAPGTALSSGNSDSATTLWLDQAGRATAAWVFTGASPGIGIATHDGSSWSSAIATPTVPLSSVFGVQGAGGGTAQRPVSMVVASGTASGVQGLYAAVDDAALTVPGAPTIGTATVSGVTASVAFTAPANDGGPDITSYTATCTSSNGGTTRTGAASSSPVSVAQLSRGKDYTCAVRAVNPVGQSAASSASNAVTPPTVAPGAPTVGTVTVSGQSASVPVTAPADDGGSAISTYTAVCASSDGGTTRTGEGASSPVAVAGLTRGRTYACTVTATNGAGVSAASSATSSFAVPASIPGAPTAVVATVASATALRVAWEAPSDDGGTAITTYTATAVPGAATCQTTGATQCEITGLTAGTAYTVVVVATNAVGDGPASSPSASAVPSSEPVAGASGAGASVPTANAGTVPATRGRIVFALTPRPLWGADGPGEAPTGLLSRIAAPGPGTIVQTGSVPQVRMRGVGARRAQQPVCTARVVVRAEGAVRVTCRLTDAARATLRSQSLRVRLTTAFIAADGSATRSHRVVVIPRAPAQGAPVAVTG